MSWTFTKLLTQNSETFYTFSLLYSLILTIHSQGGGSPYTRYTADVPLDRYGLAKIALHKGPQTLEIHLKGNHRGFIFICSCSIGKMLIDSEIEWNVLKFHEISAMSYSHYNSGTVDCITPKEHTSCDL